MLNDEDACNAYSVVVNSESSYTRCAVWIINKIAFAMLAKQLSEA